MDAWRNLRKKALGRSRDYAHLEGEQLASYELRLEQVIRRRERLSLTANYAATAARREAQRIVLLAMEALNADHAAINLITKHNQVTIASTDVAVDAPNSTRPRDQSWCQHVVGTGDVLAIENGAEHALVRDTEAAKSGETASYLGHPIRIQGEVVGALCVYDDHPRQWTEDDVHKLSQLAEVATDAGRPSSFRGDRDRV